MQIIEIKKYSLKGSILDLGSKHSPTNVSNFLKNNNKSQIIYADKYSKNKKELKIDLEKITKIKIKKFDNVLLLNVLEHIFNFDNCIKNSKIFLKKGGYLVGSTPFFFRIHGSPNDYFRYTEQSLFKILKKHGFREIKIKIIGGGIFICFYNAISLITKKVILLNNILFIICKLLDFIISIFSKNTKNIYPLGYFFQGKK